MVLGKRFDPEADETYRKVLDIERKSHEVSKRLVAVAEEVKGMEDGYLATEHHAEAVKGLVKRRKAATEDYMRLLEALDSLATEEHQSMARTKRKSVVNDINASLDRGDQLQQRIDTLSERTPQGKL